MSVCGVTRRESHLCLRSLCSSTCWTRDTAKCCTKERLCSNMPTSMITGQQSSRVQNTMITHSVKPMMYLSLFHCKYDLYNNTLIYSKRVSISKFYMRFNLSFVGLVIQIMRNEGIKQMIPWEMKLQEEMTPMRRKCSQMSWTRVTSNQCCHQVCTFGAHK